MRFNKIFDHLVVAYFLRQRHPLYIAKTQLTNHTWRQKLGHAWNIYR